MGFISRQTQEVLTDEALRRVAPSIFAQEPWEGMSSRYAFLPTINIVNQMRQEGLQPFYAVQAEYRALAKLRHPDVGGNPAMFRELNEEYNAALKHAGRNGKA